MKTIEERTKVFREIAIGVIVGNINDTLDSTRCIGLGDKMSKVFAQQLREQQDDLLNEFTEIIG